MLSPTTTSLLPGATTTNAAPGHVHESVSSSFGDSLTTNPELLTAGSRASSSNAMYRAAGRTVVASAAPASSGAGSVTVGLGAVIEDELYIGGVRDVSRAVNANPPIASSSGSVVAVAADSTPSGHSIDITPPRQSLDGHTAMPRLRAFVSVATEIGLAQLPAVVAEAVTAGEAAFLHVPLRDTVEQPLADAVATIAAFVDEQRALGRAVVVFCREGRSRSVACVAGYLMRRDDVTFEEALETVRRVRRQADPNLGFVAQLSPSPVLSVGNAAASRTSDAGLLGAGGASLVGSPMGGCFVVGGHDGDGCDEDDEDVPILEIPPPC